MKKLLFVATSILGLTLVPAFAQMGGSHGPNLGGAVDKLYGANQTFSGTLEIQGKTDKGADVTMPGKMSFDKGKSRFELNIGDIKGSDLPADAAQQLKSMGMDVLVTLTRPDLKVTDVIYPGLNSYAETPLQDGSASLTPNDYKLETSDLGKETVEGHECAKSKATVTDKDGTKHEYTVWNATDLKNFPIKIVMTEDGHPATWLYKNISFAKPVASQFDVPSGLTKYTDVQTMMQTEMMKKMAGLGAQH